MKSLVKAQLLQRGFRVSTTTKPEQLDRFFALMKPVTTNHALVRVGGAGDGGYLVPDDLDGIAACFSPGVAETAAFEENLAARGIRCFLADYSVERPPVLNALFDFQKKFLGPHNDSIFMTLESWVRQSGVPDPADLVLQMDIEGAEYGVLLETPDELLKRFRVMVFEFHELDALCDRHGFQVIYLTFVKLLKHFDIVHIHPNNYSPPVRYGRYEIPPLLEMTLLRKDRIDRREPTRSFPHPLDATNVPEKEDFALPRCWFESAR